jgi:hypothetical protein
MQPADPAFTHAKRFAMGHHAIFSNQTLLVVPAHRARCMVLSWIAEKHTEGTIHRAIEFCALRVSVSAERIVRLKKINGRKAAKSYFIALFPQTSASAEHVQASKLLIGRLEGLIEIVAAAAELDDVPMLFCTRLLDAIENHVRVFGENSPATLEERKERKLAQFESILLTLGQISADHQNYPYLTQQLGHLRMSLHLLGCGVEMAIVEEIVRAVGH